VLFLARTANSTRNIVRRKMRHNEDESLGRRPLEEAKNKWHKMRCVYAVGNQRLGDSSAPSWSTLEESRKESATQREVCMLLGTADLQTVQSLRGVHT
jgi:hypothetical protein